MRLPAAIGNWKQREAVHVQVTNVILAHNGLGAGSRFSATFCIAAAFALALSRSELGDAGNATCQRYEMILEPMILSFPFTSTSRSLICRYVRNPCLSWLVSTSGKSRLRKKRDTSGPTDRSTRFASEISALWNSTAAVQAYHAPPVISFQWSSASAVETQDHGSTRKCTWTYADREPRGFVASEQCLDETFGYTNLGVALCL
jgi:hypothetical protein